MTAKLALENGTVLAGESFGASGERAGEVVFNTSMTGYQEILTDPSYCGQIVTMTYPLIGNYGVNFDDLESARPQVAGFVVREYVDYFSNWRAKQSLGSWLKQHGIVAIQGVDTRMLTRMIRTAGAMRGMLSTQDLSDEGLIEKARNSPKMAGRDLTRKVTTEAAYPWNRLDETPYALKPVRSIDDIIERRFRVVVYDYGVKQNILRRLTAYGCDLTVVPSDFAAEETLALKPDGIFLSNGPGDPEPVKYAIEGIKRLIGKRPIFGICLGHQLLAHALGGKTFKLKFGHRGANHPVKNLSSRDIEITTQNHGFAVDWGSMDEREVELTHVNLNDQTVEGFRHRGLPIFCVQYHPEASAGPHDSDYLFAEFIDLMQMDRMASQK